MKIIRITTVTDIVSIILLQSVTLRQRLSIAAVSNFSDCNLVNIIDLVECADAVIVGDRHGNAANMAREVSPLKTALELVADYGCMHTHIDAYNDFAVAIQKNSSNIGHAPQEVS